MNKLITKKLIIKNNNVLNKTDLFQLICDVLLKEKFIDDESKLLNDLVARENLGSTAFENGLVIPHCRTSAIKEPKLVVVGFNDNDFDSIDKNKSNFAVAIIVPDSAANEHLKILSKLSKLFSTKDKLELFKKMSVNEKVSQINGIKLDDNKKVNTEIKKGNYDFVGVTSCAAGIAHTYMARDALLEAAQKLNLKAKIETRGSITENSLSKEEIDNAKFVVIAADVTISKKRFAGKRLYETDTNSAIRDGVSVIENAMKSKKLTGNRANKADNTPKKREKLLGKAVMSAISYMIPIVIVGALLMAIPSITIAGDNKPGTTPAFPNSFIAALYAFGGVGLKLMVPMFAMFLAFKIGGKPAIPAALIGGYFINDGALMGKFSIFDLPKDISSSASAGFLGGLAVGLIVGYMVRLMQWIKWHRWIKPVSNMMIVPIFSSLLTFMIIVYIIGTPMTWLMAQLFIGLKAIQSGGIWASIGIGILFAVMIAVDLGGPINKTAWSVSMLIFAQTLMTGNPNFVPLTAVKAAISVPPIGMWLSTVIFRSKFSWVEKQAGAAALPMGLTGITEGALPFAFKTPLKAIFANICGAFVAGGLVSMFSIAYYAGIGSPLDAYIGFVKHDFYGLAWIFSILVGVVTTALIYGLLRNKVPEYEKLHKEHLKDKKAKYAKMGVHTKNDLFKHHYSKMLKNAKPKFLYCINPKHWFKNPNQDDDYDL